MKSSLYSGKNYTREKGWAWLPGQDSASYTIKTVNSNWQSLSFDLQILRRCLLVGKRAYHSHFFRHHDFNSIITHLHTSFTQKPSHNHLYKTHFTSLPAKTIHIEVHNASINFFSSHSTGRLTTNPKIHDLWRILMPSVTLRLSVCCVYPHVLMFYNPRTPHANQFQVNFQVSAYTLLPIKPPYLTVCAKCKV